MRISQLVSILVAAPLRLPDAGDQHREAEQHRQDEARQEAREIELGNRGVGHHAVDDHVDRGRDQDAERAAGGERAEEQRLVVLVLVDLAHRHDADGRRGGDARPRDRAEQRARADVGMHQPAGQPRQPLHQGGIHALGRAAAQQDLAEHDVEGNGRQDEVAGGRPGELADDAAHRHRRVELVQRARRPGPCRRRPQSSCRAGTSSIDKGDAGGHCFFSCSSPCGHGGDLLLGLGQRRLRADQGEQAVVVAGDEGQQAAHQQQQRQGDEEQRGRRTTGPAGSPAAPRWPTASASPTPRTARRRPRRTR